MAMRRPTFSPVTFSNRVAPRLLKFRLTLARFFSKVGWASATSSPESMASFSTAIRRVATSLPS